MLRRLIRNLEKRRLEKALVLPCRKTEEFNCAVDWAQDIAHNNSAKDEKVILLDYMLSVVRDDLKTDLLSTIFYDKEHFERRLGFPFPDRYFDEKDTEIKFSPNGERSVSLANDCVLTLPWNRYSTRNCILGVFTNGFQFDKGDHEAEYFTHVDIYCVKRGYHSIAAGVVYKNGSVQAKEYDVSRLFKHMHTDGEFWYNSHNKQKLGAVFDFRVGIIYEIAKLKHQILNAE